MCQEQVAGGSGTFIFVNKWCNSVFINHGHKFTDSFIFFKWTHM